MWETYDWYMDRLFDHKVREFLESQITKGAAHNGQTQTFPIAKSVEEITTATKLSNWRVRGCLNRLRKNKSVSQEGERWKIVVAK